MARKRLSDLLREEAQKPPEVETEAVSLVDEAEDGQEAIAPPAKTSRSKPAAQTAAQTAAAKAVVVTPDPLILELKTALEEAKDRESDYQQEILDLKAEVKAQTAIAQKLQTSLEKTEHQRQQLEEELAEAKQTALQLAATNSQLKQEQADRKQEQAQKQAQLAESKAAESKAAESKSASQKLAPTKPPASSGTISQQEILRRQRQSLVHPVFPGKQPGHISEQDIGWVD